MSEITVIGGGFAGVEAAWAAATRGAKVVLYEMRPKKMTTVHKTGDLAELVCSNSFKSNLLTNASGVLKEEMRRLGSVILPIAQKHRVPAGEALAVDREPFAREVTETIASHPNIRVIHEEICELPESRPLIIATGPLTSDCLAERIRELAGESLYFYDAVAPTVTLDSLDLTKVYRASRRGRNDRTTDHRPPTTDCIKNSESLNRHPSSVKPNDPTTQQSTDPDPEGDYLNCPMNKDEYLAFHRELAAAEASVPHNPEDEKVIYFEMCVPVEELAAAASARYLSAR